MKAGKILKQSAMRLGHEMCLTCVWDTLNFSYIFRMKYASHAFGAYKSRSAAKRIRKEHDGARHDRANADPRGSSPARLARLTIEIPLGILT